MSEYTVADVSYNQDGEIEQFLIFSDSGEPDTRRATPENLLLFDPEDELPFDGGLQPFFSGDEALVLSEDPETIVSQAGDEYSYIVSVDGSVVETMPKQTERLLSGVYEALVDDNCSKIHNLHHKIMETQVRRDLVNALKRTFTQHNDITIVENGWLIDGFYLIDWNAKMYADKNNPDEGAYKREGGTAVKKDKTYELVQLDRYKDTNLEPDDVIEINGQTFELTEREMMFLSKVEWLLNREHYHPDKPFWEYLRRWEDVGRKEPDMETFSL
jgi:hypothetical protein